MSFLVCRQEALGWKPDAFLSLLPSSNSVSDADGQMKVVQVATRPLTQDLLDHNASSIVNKD